MKKIINGTITFEVTFNAIGVVVNDGCENDPEALFEAIVDSWYEGYSEQLGVCLDEYQSDFDDEQYRG